MVDPDFGYHPPATRVTNRVVTEKIETNTTKIAVILLLFLWFFSTGLAFWQISSTRSRANKQAEKIASEIKAIEDKQSEQVLALVQGTTLDSLKVKHLKVNGFDLGALLSGDIMQSLISLGLQGPTGPQGTPGAKGAKGSTGPQGDSGSATTSLNASNISSGTLADARLSTNVALLNGTGPQTFSGNNKFTGTLLQQNTVNSTSALAVQNAEGEQLLNIDTATNLNQITSPNSNFESGTTNWQIKGSSTLVSQTSKPGYRGSGALKISTSANANDGAYFTTTLSVGVTYTLSMYVQSSDWTPFFTIGQQNVAGGPVNDVDCVLVNPYAPIDIWNRVSCTFVAGAGAGAGSNIYIKQTDATARDFWVDGVQLENTSAATPYGIGLLSVDSVVSAPLVLRNAVDSSNAFEIQSASGIELLKVDTINGYLQTPNGIYAGDPYAGLFSYLSATGLYTNADSTYGVSPLYITESTTGGLPFIAANMNGTSQTGDFGVYNPWSGGQPTIYSGFDNINQSDSFYLYNAYTGGYPLYVVNDSVGSDIALGNNNSDVSVSCGSGAQCSFGTNSTAHTTIVGSTTTTSALTLQAGTGTISIGTSSSARSVLVGTGAAQQTVTVGSTSAASSLTLAAGTGSISIGTSASARTVNVATGAANQTLTLGSNSGTSSTSIQVGTGGLNIATGASARAVNIATGAAAQTVTFGSTNTTSSLTLNSGTNGINLGTGGIANTIQIGNTSGAVTQTINIGNNSTASSTNNVTIGSTIAGTTAIQGAATITNRTSGSANTLLLNNSSSTGTILLAQDNGTAVFTIQDSGTVLAKPFSNSPTAFQVQDTSNNAELLVDTSNSKVVVTTLEVTVDLTVTGTSTFNGNIVFNSNIRGYNAAVTITSTTLAITGKTYPDTNFTVFCTPDWDTTCFVTGKSTTGFTLNFGTAAPGGQVVDWVVIR